MEKTAEQWVTEGDELDDAGQRDEAMKCFDLAIELDPNYARAWFLKGYLLENMGLSLSDAEEHYQKAIDLGMNTKLAYRNVAGVRMATGQVKEALAAYLKALEIDPEELRDLPDIAVLYEELGNEEEAMKYLELCMERDPNSIRGNAFKGNFHLKQGETSKAIEHYKVALEGNPTFERVCYNLGKAYMTLGQEEEAIEIWERASNMEPLNADNYCYRGQCYLMLEKKDLAFADFRKAQELLDTDKTTLLSPNFIRDIKATLEAVLEAENFRNEATQKFKVAIQENKNAIQMKALYKTEKYRNIEELNKVKLQTIEELDNQDMKP